MVLLIIFYPTWEEGVTHHEMVRPRGPPGTLKGVFDM